MAEINLPKAPERCICGRLPVASKVKSGGWVLCCPEWRACDRAPTGGSYSTLSQAVDGWNDTIDLLRKKEGKA